MVLRHRLVREIYRLVSVHIEVWLFLQTLHPFHLLEGTGLWEFVTALALDLIIFLIVVPWVISHLPHFFHVTVLLLPLPFILVAWIYNRLLLVLEFGGEGGCSDSGARKTTC